MCYGTQHSLHPLNRLVITIPIKKGHQALSIKTIPKKLSRDNSKLCFEALEIRLVPQNHLPLHRRLKKLQSRFLFGYY